jgi:hypothetical protein
MASHYFNDLVTATSEAQLLFLPSGYLTIAIHLTSTFPVHKFNATTKITKYKQNIAKHNSVDDFIKVYSYIILSTTCFGPSYEPSSG